jgi:hypothetical protein
MCSCLYVSWDWCTRFDPSRVFASQKSCTVALVFTHKKPLVWNFIRKSNLCYGGPLQCPTGWYSGAASTFCISCPAGKYLTNASGGTEARSCTNVSMSKIQTLNQNWILYLTACLCTILLSAIWKSCNEKYMQKCPT